MVVEWLHVLAAIIWVGGNAILDIVVWRALLQRPGTQAEPIYTQIGRYTAPVMAASGMVTLIFGIVRGTLLGQIQSVDALFGTAYGLTWLASLVLTLVMIGWGATWHGRRLGPIWEGDALRPGAVQRLRAGSIFELVGFGVILILMVMMSTGY
jgi:uncharacterized membrane protein